MRKIIALLMLCVAVAFFLRCYWHELSGDELRYQYVWEAEDSLSLWKKGHRYERKIGSFADIVQSQKKHYIKANGRTLVHSAEQAMSGRRGFVFFCFFNTAVFLIFIWLVVRYTCGAAASRRDAVPWILAVLALLYLMPFQRTLWTSINYGPNYLWPSVLTVALLAAWRRVAAEPRRRGMYIAAAVLAFVTGWSNEAFSVGLSLGSGAYVLWLLMRRRFSARLLWVALPLWAGTAILIAAPGNWHRLGVMTASDIWLRLRIGSLFYTGLSLKLVWLLLFGVIAAALTRRHILADFARQNRLLIACWCGTVAFMSVVSKGVHSMCGVELLSLLLLMRLCACAGWFGHQSRLRTALAAVAALAVVASQTVICRDTLKIYRFQHALVQSYCLSEDGLVLCDEPPVSDFTRPYIRLWELPPTPYTEIFSIEQVYGHYRKPSVCLNAADYNAVADTAAFYATAHRVPGDAGAYAADGGVWMWLRPGTFSRGERFRLKLAHVGLTSDDPIDSKIQRIARPLAWQDSYTSKVDTVRTRYGEAYRIAIPRRRKLLELNRMPKRDW